MCVNSGSNSSPNANPLRFVVNHNPFYLISTLLLLYGLQVATDSGASIHEHKLAAILCGVIVLMAITVVAIVKFGGVWEDARTILLSIMLLLVGVTIGCDTEVMENRNSAAMILIGGLVFGIVVWETLLWLLKIKLPFGFRVPVYLMHGLFFLWSMIFFKEGTPNLLGSLSPSWRLYMFGWAFAAAMLTFVPVIRQGRNLFRNNGTPWKWPTFPWSILVVLVAAACVRIYMMSLAFIPKFGWESPLAAHFFMPIFFAVYVLVVELSASFFPRVKNAYMLGAMPLLLLAAPWQLAEMPSAFVSEVSATVGNPLWLLLMMLVAFGATLWMRGRHDVEFGVHMFLVAAVFVCPDRPEVSAAPVSAIPLLVLAIFQACRAWKFASSIRWVVAGVFAAVAARLMLPSEVFSDVFAWGIAAHLAWFGLLLTGVLCADKFAAKLRLSGLAIACAFVVIAIVGACLGRWPGWFAVTYIAGLQSVIFLCGRNADGSLLSRVAVAFSAGWLVAFADFPDLALAEWLGARAGMFVWLACICFVFGVIISCGKAGWLNLFEREWRALCLAIRDELNLPPPVDA